MSALTETLVPARILFRSVLVKLPTLPKELPAGVEQALRATVLIQDRDGFGSGFLVTPVVAFVRPGFELALDAQEVQSVFEVPVDYLFDTGNHRTRKRPAATRPAIMRRSSNL